MIKPKNTALVKRICEKRKCMGSSARTYASTLRRINRDYSDKGFTADLKKWLLDESILKKILKHDSLAVKRNLVNSAAVGLSIISSDEATKLREKYSQALQSLNQEQESKRGVLSKKQEKKKDVTWDSVLKLKRLVNRTVTLGQYYKRTKVVWKDFEKIQQALFLHLYTLLPPVRLSYADVRFFKESEYDKNNPPSGNLLLLLRGGYRLFWAQYKTVKSHGIQEVEVPRKLQRILKKHIKYLRKHWPENRYLILNSKYQKMSRNSLSRAMVKLFQKHFNRPVSVSDLRRIFLSEKYNRKDLEDRAETARKMLHSQKTALDYYIFDK
jgi:hypothetical protein